MGAGQELYLQITLDENGSVATVNNLGQAITKAGGESQSAASKVDQLSGSMGKSDSTTTSLIGTLKGLGLAYAALRLERMVEGWVRLDMAQAQADNSLRAAMISNNRFSESFYQSTLKQAEALQKLTGVRDQDIERGQRMLMLYGNISNDMMPRTTQAMVNLSALMEGDVKSAAVQLGKAMEGQVESLKRVGIVIDENVFKQRGAIGVLEEVEKKVNGQAVSLTEGAGKWKLLGTAIDGAKEAIGAAFTQIAEDSGILQRTIDLVNKFTELMRSWGATPQQKIGWQVEDVKKLNTELVSAQSTLEAMKAHPLKGWLGEWLNEGSIESATQHVKSLNDKINRILTNLADTPTFLEMATKVTEDSLPPIKVSTDAVRDLAKIFENAKSHIEACTESLSEFGAELIRIQWGLLTKGPLASPGTDQIFNKSGMLGQPHQSAWENLSLGGFSTSTLTLTPTPSSAQLDAEAEALAKLDLAAYEKAQAKIKAGMEELKRQQDEIAARWNSIANGMGSSFTDALVGSIMGNKNAFEDMGKFIAKTMLSTMIDQQITQKFVQPFIDKIMAGMNRKLVPAGTVPGEGQIVAPGWMGSNPNQTSQYIGYGVAAGTTAYGIGSSGYQTGYQGGSSESAAFQGAVSGATTGFALGGPPGAGAGAVAGGALGYWSAEIGEDIANQKAKKEALKAHIEGFWTVAANEVKLVSSDWQNKHPEVANAIKEAVQNQVDFYKLAGQIYGKATGSFGGSYSGAYNNLGSVGGLPGLAANFDLIKSLGSEAMTGAEEAFRQTFQNPWTSKSFRGTFENTINQGWDILKNSSSETRQADFEKWFSSSSMHKDNSGWMAPSLFATSDAGLESFMTKYQGELQEVVDFFAGNVSNALADGINSTGDKLGTFYDSLKNNLAATVGEALKQGFIMNDMLPILMKSFGEITGTNGEMLRPSLTNLLTDYSTGKTSLSDTNTYIGQMGADFNENLKLMEPLFGGLVTVLESVNTALVVNTDATVASTNSLQTYSDSVDSFLNGLTGGSLAPNETSASMMERYNTLYSQALLDPSKFNDLSGFTGGSYLPWLQGTSADYAGSYTGITSQIAGLKTAWGMPADTTSSVNPADYAMSTTAGQTQGPGFKQMMKEALQEVVAEKLAAMLKDIADAAREDRELTGSIEIKGKIGALMCESIATEPDTRQVVHNA